jgi:hypothetical protein
MKKRDMTPEQKAFLFLIFPLLYNVFHLFGLSLTNFNDGVVIMTFLLGFHIASYIGLTLAIQTKYTPLIFMGILTTSWLILTTTHIFYGPLYA